MAYSSAFPQSSYDARYKNNNNRPEGESLSYSIISYLGRLSDPDHAGWCKELNLVSWNNSQPRYDIRSWSQSHDRMSKGIGLNVQELVYLYLSLEHLRCVDQHFAALINKVALMSSAASCGGYQQQDASNLLLEQPNSWDMNNKIPDSSLEHAVMSRLMNEGSANTQYCMDNNVPATPLDATPNSDLGRTAMSSLMSAGADNTLRQMTDNVSIVDSNYKVYSELGSYGIVSLSEVDVIKEKQEQRNISNGGNLWALTAVPEGFAKDGAE